MFSVEERHFDKENRFVIRDYNRSKPFASFLPGIAGKKGIPLWVFYVNRGQCIAAFGISNKDNAIMEFFPAFRSYRNVETVGFRTFIKVNGRKFYEPFSAHNRGETVQEMHIGMNELELQERSSETGIETNILYYTLPMERIAALVRKVTIKNVSSTTRNLEILDGIPVLLPYGISDYGLKHVGNTLKAWMDVYRLESRVPIFRLRSTTEDTVSISEVEEGNFYLSLQSSSGKAELIAPIVDPDLIFGTRTSMSFPEVFSQEALGDITAKSQISCNKVPCAFSPVKSCLKPGEETVFYSVTGHVADISVIDGFKKKIMDENYLAGKHYEAKLLVKEITQDIHTQTSSKLFDMYCKQDYLDNIMRGGYPLVFSEGERVYHIYSRKHGDLERDYNYFVLLPEYYSCGNGNYRDVNQNRREDVFFNPGVERYDIKLFMNLIQADGYNPLVINGVRYRVKSEKLGFIDQLVAASEISEELKAFLSEEPFTPGKLASFIEERELELKVQEDELLRRVIKVSEQEVDAFHGEGFWTDHWTYNLDLIESYLEIYPERKKELLFDDCEYTYFDNTNVVLPRSKRYVLVDEDRRRIRQYDFLVEDLEKKRLIESRKLYKNAMREERGKGRIYRTNLITKLTNLAAIKFATLDPSGMGIEMEAGKPGWYDALNGLPGLFGSSVAEAFELSRLISFIEIVLKEHPDEIMRVPEELMSLIESLMECVEDYKDSSDDRRDHRFWEALSDIRERYRQETRLGFQGTEIAVKSSEMSTVFEEFNEKLSAALDSAIEENNGIMPTYFYYKPEEFQIIGESDDQSRKYVKIRSFRQKRMPLFLEGIVRGFRTYRDKDFLKEVHAKVKNSELYDRKLKMYKVNGPLINETIEVGRAKAFTPGWLENESIWLHMEYKYILEVLRSELYDEFFEDFRNVLVPFMDPDVYGRSTLENSSFIASSANPDESVHGTGFVARLSGSTAEFLSIWKAMFAGPKPFACEKGRLVLRFRPILPGWLFDEEGTVTFNFLGKCEVTYYNPNRINTYDAELMDTSKWKTTVFDNNGKKVEFAGNTVDEPYSRFIREGKVRQVSVSFYTEDWKDEEDTTERPERIGV